MEEGAARKKARTTGKKEQRRAGREKEEEKEEKKEEKSEVTLEDCKKGSNQPKFFESENRNRHEKAFQMSY